MRLNFLSPAESAEKIANKGNLIILLEIFGYIYWSIEKLSLTIFSCKTGVAEKLLEGYLTQIKLSSLIWRSISV